VTSARPIYEYYADNAEKFLADEPIDLVEGEGSALIRRSSVGVLLGIMPWNYPYYQVARFAGPNLTLGQHHPAQARSPVPGVGGGNAADLHRRRLPRRRIRQHLRHQLNRSPTSSPTHACRGFADGLGARGAAVAEIAGRNLKKVVLELGGSDPFIVLSS
jgi:succinate-semialdehyde dehydrogenase/glutarate-semialdehyde dehydrogenase